jgi:hypothetical protein
MDLKEISSLIEIKHYVQETINNYAIDKASITELQKMLVLIDKTIINKLLGSEFKEFINFADANKAIREAAENNNIKSGLTWTGNNWSSKK